MACSPAGTKVLHVCAVGSTARVLLINLASGLRAAGASVGFAFGFDGRTEHDLRARGFDCFHVPFSRRLPALHRHLPAFLAYRRLLDIVRPDLVTLSTLFPGVIGRMVRRRGTKVVLLAHGSFWDDGVPRPVRLVWDWVERLVAGRADLILTNNREDRDDTVAAGNAPNRVKHMPGGLRGIDLHRYTRPTLTGDEKVRRRQELGLPGGTLVGVFGRVTPAKGLVDLCRAIVRLADVDVHLLFVGAARGERGGSRTLSAIQHLGPRATYWGWVDNPIPLMELCDIVVNPSLREGLGLVSVEAGALAVPVVATSTRGSRYAVLHEQTGLLVPPRDAAALALAIRRLASNPEEAHRMGQAGQSRNRELFDAHAVTTRVVAELSGVLAGHVRRHDAKTVAVDRGCRI